MIVCDRCGELVLADGGTATDVCTVCDPVPLCGACLRLHADEAAGDGTAP